MQIEKTKDEKLTIFLDASSLKNSSCLRRQFYDIVEGYKEGTPNNDTVFGTAFHKFRAHWRETGDFFKAMNMAKKCYEESPKIEKQNKKFLTTGFLLSVCEQYEEAYKNDEFQVYRDKQGNSLIEPATRFAFPYHSDDDVDILIAGTMDELGRFRISKNFGICDVKTSVAYDIRKFMNSFKLSPQLKMYRWALRKYAKFNPDSIWAEIDREVVCCFIDGVFYKAPAKDGTPTVTLARKDHFGAYNYIIFKDSDLEEFERMLKIHIIDIFLPSIKHYLKTGEIPDREGILTDSCDGKFGPCKYAEACSSPDKEAREAYLNHTFVKRHYNPMTFGEQP